MPADYSIIIVTYNSAAWVGGCIDALLRQQTECGGLELIVVDNASTDDTMDIVRDGYPQVRCLLNRANLGFAAAVNQGAAVAECSRLLILNPDASIRPGFFSALESFFAHHPGSVVGGCALVESDGRPQISCWSTPSLWTVFLESALPYAWSIRLVTETPAETRPVDAVSGACMVVGREDFLRLGGFDERFFMYYEDFDFCMRAKQSGIPVYYLREASVTHHVRKSTSNAGELFFLYVNQSKLKIVEKHESGAAHVLAYLMILSGILVRIPVYALAGKLFSKPELLQLSKYHTFVLPKFAASLFS